MCIKSFVWEKRCESILRRAMMSSLSKSRILFVSSPFSDLSLLMFLITQFTHLLCTATWLTVCVIFRLQSAGWVIHVVPVPPEINPLHPMASVQMGDNKSTWHYAAYSTDCSLLLLHAGIYGQENHGGVISLGREPFHGERCRSHLHPSKTLWRHEC